MLEILKEGGIVKGLQKEFVCNEGDVEPTNANKIKGNIKSGSTLIVMMDDGTIVAKIFDAKHDRWLEL